MKNKLFLLGLLPLAIALAVPSTKAFEADAAGESPLTKTIILKHRSEDEIRNYYSNLNSLDEGERRGDNLLKNLKPILRNNFEYLTYANVWKAYEITDRDWSLSPASETTYGTYDEATQRINDYVYGSNSQPKNNPYVHAYYRDQTDKTGDYKIKAWDDHKASGINREHLWCQSHGFKDPDSATGPAGTDLHHLVAADGQVNQAIHNNSPYGNVAVDSSTSYGNRESTKGNKVGKPKTTSTLDIDTLVFEPIDSDKGDIARALFYMVAMYNNIAGKSGVISQFDPNLELVSYVTTSANITETSSDLVSCKFGNLKDLLEWHKQDPVDDYEIYRNDLIYNNYQNNRNPFIDFPEWVDVIWGDKKDSGFASPATDAVYEGQGKAPSGGGDTSGDTSKDTPSEGGDSAKSKWLTMPLILVPIAGGVVLLILLIVIFASLSKKNRKKVTKKVTKAIKKSSKKKR